jgi:hypothetical protein
MDDDGLFEAPGQSEVFERNVEVGPDEVGHECLEAGAEEGRSLEGQFGRQVIDRQDDRAPPREAGPLRVGGGFEDINGILGIGRPDRAFDGAVDVACDVADDPQARRGPGTVMIAQKRLGDELRVLGRPENAIDDGREIRNGILDDGLVITRVLVVILELECLLP